MTVEVGSVEGKWFKFAHEALNGSLSLPILLSSVQLDDVESSLTADLIAVLFPTGCLLANRPDCELCL
jgi:hypothetical protein